MRPETFCSPGVFGTVQFWTESSRYRLFWMSVCGAPLVALLFGWRFADSGSLAALIFFGLVMFTMAITDEYSQYLPDFLTLSCMWIGLLIQLIPAMQTIGIDTAVVSAAGGYLLLWLIAKLFLLIRKQDGLGHGDMKLIAATGAWLGPIGVFTAILFGSIFALLYQGARRIIHRSNWREPFAFGPWLAFGSMAAAMIFI